MKEFKHVINDPMGMHARPAGMLVKAAAPFASTITRDGKMNFYSGEGTFTDAPLGEGNFGCIGAAHIPGLQKKLRAIGYGGFRHHVCTAPGNWKRALDEALTRYLKYQITEI